MRSGAPISFVQIERFNNRMKRREAMGRVRAAEEKIKPEPLTTASPNGLKEETEELRNSGREMHAYMSAMFAEGRVVYCRFGQDYIPNLAKQAQSLINNPNLPQRMR